MAGFKANCNLFQTQLCATEGAKMLSQNEKVKWATHRNED